MSNIRVYFNDGHSVDYSIRTRAIGEAFRDLESNPNVDHIDIVK